jgi:hypothetical protein
LPENVIDEELHVLSIVEVEEIAQGLPGHRVFDLDNTGIAGKE